MLSQTTNTGVFYAIYSHPMLLLLILFLLFVFHIALAVYTYNDAKKRSGMDQSIWVLIIALTGLFGFIVYIIVR
jgi:hypothetical protein